jgi:DNA polymerase III subunit beta
MRFSLSKAALLRELNLLQGVVEKKNTIPILSNVLIETLGESLVSLIATDLDVSMQTECTADVAEPGAVVMQARKLFDIVRNLPDAEIHFSKEENDWVRIECGSSSFRVVGQAKEHFPSTPGLSEGGQMIPVNALRDLISRTIYAITQEESRYALNGALCLLEEGKLKMVATDGHRLALTEFALEGAGDQQMRVIIPRKALSELHKLTANAEGALVFAKDENHLYFKLGQRLLTSRMLAGQFPNYDLVLPKNNDKHIPMNTERFAQSIRRAALMADERSHGIKLELSSGKINLTSQSADVGEAKEVIPVDYNGDTVSIGFNAQYIADFLSVVGTDQVTLEIKDEQSPALLKPAGDGQYDYRYVVMPMRLI